MVACVEKVLKEKHNKGWEGTNVTVFGATGVVGFASSVIAALEGAKVKMVAHRGVERVFKAAEAAKERFGVDMEPVPGDTPEKKASIVADAEVVFAAAAAGIQILSTAELQSAKNLLVAADVNAVPPPGIEGMDLFMNGDVLPGCSKTCGVGPLAIGDIKYKTQAGLLTRMLSSEEALHLDFRDAFKLARSFVA
jgi:methylene-tetrahydromethanopterin dehydrogenase